MAFSGDGKMLAGTDQTTVRLWNVGTGQRTAVLGHSDLVSTIATSADGQRLMSGSLDGTVRVWALPAGVVTHRFDGLRKVFAVAIARDGRTLAGGGGSVLYHAVIRLWDLRTDTVIHELETDDSSEVVSMAFSPDGLTLASVSGQIERADGVWLWDVRRGRLNRRIATGARYDLMSYSPDGRFLAAAGNSRTGSWLLTVDARTGEVLRDGPGGRPDAMAFSPDGSTLAIAYGGEVWLWMHLTDEVRRIRSVERECVSVAISPDGRYLAHGSDEVALWDLRTRARFRTLR